MRNPRLVVMVKTFHVHLIHLQTISIYLSFKSDVLEDNRMEIVQKRNEHAYLFHHLQRFFTIGKRSLIGWDMCHCILCFFILQNALLLARQDNERKTHPIRMIIGPKNSRNNLYSFAEIDGFVWITILFVGYECYQNDQQLLIFLFLKLKGKMHQSSYQL